MLQYGGGKSLTLRHYGMDTALLALLHRHSPARVYDVMCGGGAATAYMADVYPAEYYAADLHPAAVCVLRALGTGWQPPAVLGYDEWARLSVTGVVPWPACVACRELVDCTVLDRAPWLVNAHTCEASQDPLHGFAGFGVSYGGMYYRAYGGQERAKWRDPVGGMRAACLDAVPALRRVRGWANGDYRRVLGLPGSDALWTLHPGDFVYVDKPYENTLGYVGMPPFDHLAFWAWAADLVRAGVVVVVSEFGAPVGWVAVWSCYKAQPIRNGRNGASSNFVYDSLYMMEGYT
jgi:hypothetical protein